ncbi:hypothetical protein ABFA07_010491 [Porites harrisoni]
MWKNWGTSSKPRLNQGSYVNKKSEEFTEVHFLSRSLGRLKGKGLKAQRNFRDEGQWKRVEDDKQRRKTLLTE